METTMKDEAHIKRERQKQKLKVILAVIMGLVPIATFFFLMSAIPFGTVILCCPPIKS